MNEPLKEVRSAGEGIINFTDGSFLIPNVTGRLVVGQGTRISPDIEIGLPDKPVGDFIVGDFCRLYAGQIASRNFLCGDYVTIHEGVWAFGRNDITIGHNSWFGRRCTLDAEGRFGVGNGFGAGQDSHLWSHIRHGDTLLGNRYLSFGEFVAEDDCWFVGRCTSAPAHHGARSMALVESNLTGPMPADTIWGGNPAKDLTDRIGPPIIARTTSEKEADFLGRIRQFVMETPNATHHDIDTIAATFDVERRTYRKTGHPYEVQFMRWLLPEAKFVPEGQERVG